MMATLIKFIITLSLSFFGEESAHKNDLAQYYVPIQTDYVAINDSTQLKAFHILVNKCNFCHLKRNRRRVFTEGNMNSWSNDVYKQVFVERRMPKGKEVKLSTKEYQDLLTWISSSKNNENGNQI